MSIVKKIMEMTWVELQSHFGTSYSDVALFTNFNCVKR